MFEVLFSLIFQLIFNPVVLLWTLSVMEGVGLIKLFSLDEVKVAVWEIDNYKCPGPDGIPFGFIKFFWDILKDDVLRFLVEFHRNGKFTKGINSTFIALIPKVRLTVLKG